MYQRKKATAEDEAGTNFAASLAAVYMTMGSEKRGPIADDGGTPEGQAARKAGRPRKSLRRSSKNHGPAGRAGETPQRTCGSWHGRVAYAGP